MGPIQRRKKYKGQEGKSCCRLRPGSRATHQVVGFLRVSTERERGQDLYANSELFQSPRGSDWGWWLYKSYIANKVREGPWKTWKTVLKHDRQKYEQTEY